MSRPKDGFQENMGRWQFFWEASTTMGLCPYQLAQPQGSKNSESINTATLTLSSPQALPYGYSHPGQIPATHATKELRHTSDTAGAGHNTVESSFSAPSQYLLGSSRSGPSTLGENIYHKGLQWLHSLKVGYPTSTLQDPKRRFGNWCLGEYRAYGRCHSRPTSGEWLTDTNHLRNTSTRKSERADKRRVNELRKHFTQELLSSAHDKAF